MLRVWEIRSCVRRSHIAPVPIMAIMCLLAVGCTNSIVSDPNLIIDVHIAERGFMQFGSSSATDYGMDSFTVLAFLNDGGARLFEYGCGVGEYTGTFTSDARGVISLQLSDYGEWPEMLMKREEGSYFLYTASGDDGIIWGQRAGGCWDSDMKPFWPFKWMEPVEAVEPDGLVELRDYE